MGKSGQTIFSDSQLSVYWIEIVDKDFEQESILQIFEQDRSKLFKTKTPKFLSSLSSITHRGRVTHICVSKIIIIVSNNGLSPGRCQGIIWNNAGILLIAPLGINISEIVDEINVFLFKKIHLNISSENGVYFVSVSSKTSDAAYMCQYTRSSLVDMMACRSIPRHLITIHDDVIKWKHFPR